MLFIAMFHNNKMWKPHIDIIINNAGIMPCHPFLSHSIQEIDRCIDINVKGCIWVLEKSFHTYVNETVIFNY